MFAAAAFGGPLDARPSMKSERWQFWIDRGGTFTDCLGRDPETGELRVAKLPSSDRAPLDGIRRILGLRQGEGIPPCDVRMGTTIATNALLERKGRRCLLLTTRGFRDVLEIGTQQRPHLFELDIRKPEVLYAAVLEVGARADAEGRILERPDPEAVLRDLEAQLAAGIDSVAIVILHAYRSSELELELGELAKRAGFRHVSMSHDVAPSIGFVPRGDTTTLDAYVTPLLRDYLSGVASELPGGTLRLMQSSGGLTEAGRLRGPDALLSGPAGGVVAVARIARANAVEQAIGFDMGGTSTDVSRFAGSSDLIYEGEAAGVRVNAPMLDIHTIAAGGGSLCRIDGNRLTVGPESAGAVPGPLCYGRPEATTLTVTDVNLFLGRLLPDRFPFRLAEGAPRAALERLSLELAARGFERSPRQIAQGFFEIANHNMAEAVQNVSVLRGYDVRDHALVVFGGAGGQHACAIARLLGIRTLLFHPLAGVLSAYGMGIAPVSWHGSRDLDRRQLGADELRALAPVFDELELKGRRALALEGFDDSAVEVRRRLELRYPGTEASLTLSLVERSAEGGRRDQADAEELRRAFEAEHERLFGYFRADEPIELVAARVEALGTSLQGSVERLEPERPPAPPCKHTELWSGGALLEKVPVFERETLARKQRIAGPALVLDRTATIVLDPGFSLEVEDDGLLVARDVEGAPRRKDGVDLDPVRLEVFANAFMSIAEQMGRALRRTAQSTNIRERLDFSCAVFDPDGHLIANAPHIPVHLGAMGESVRAVLERHPALEDGDVFVTNDPALGGSHLPDITVIAPVHDASGRVLFFSANRGHHADVGGITPGSMPPFSETLAQEGVVFRALRVVHRREFDREGVLAVLRSGPYPARAPLVNLSDLEAQIAATREGERLLLALVDEYGRDCVLAQMQHLQDEAESAILSAIRELGPGVREFEDALDDGTPIRLRLSVEDDRLTADFSGTGAEHAGNLNAPRAITMAAIIYFLRLLARRPIPLNDGCLRRVVVTIPAPSLLCPSPWRAVAGGNVETSQRVVDVLLGACGRAAASQGTMNNVSFGDETFGYYETLAGGAGAGPGFRGASAVHTHMTNTRITDVEILEARFPVLIREFSVRRGSGGAGRFAGGDGLVREIEFRRAVDVTILSERRTLRPFGLAGGEPGQPGRNLWNGRDVGGKARFEVQAGDRLRIETPGGGGYGTPLP